MEDGPPLSKKERIKVIAKQKAFGYKGIKGKGKTKGRVLNAQEKHALRMEGDVGKVVRLYEELRRHDCKNKHELIDKVFELQKDRLLKTGCIPRFARVYQSCAKHGSEQQLQVMLDAFKGNIAKMAISPYGNQLVLALLAYARPQQRPALHDEIEAGAKELLKSRFGQRVLQKFYRTARPFVQRRTLFNIFNRTDLRAESNNYRLSVSQVWEKNPVIRSACTHTLSALMARCVDRGLVDAPIVHELLDLMFRYCEHDRNLEALQDLKKAVIHLCSTRFGALVAEHCIRLANPADRAEILGTFSKSVLDMATGRHSIFLLCAIVDLVDDTKLVERTVLAELGKEAETLLTDPVACMFLLHLLTPEKAQKRRAFLLLRIVDRLCHSERTDWDKVEVVQSSSVKHGAPVTKSITVCSRPWVEKHAAALSYLLPHVQKVVATDPVKYAQQRSCRRILRALVHFATEAPVELRGGVSVSADFLKMVTTALAAPPTEPLAPAKSKKRKERPPRPDCDPQQAEGAPASKKPKTSPAEGTATDAATLVPATVPDNNEAKKKKKKKKKNAVPKEEAA
eukprot:GGOE01041404.1.p1 GENE.GGOE01041404.1~~GGOE01041404.1.p1  ORF type:complete len:568 (-),score=189.33 GGOE01041404.1:218-1921(-)